MIHEKSISGLLSFSVFACWTAFGASPAGAQEGGAYLVAKAAGGGAHLFLRLDSPPVDLPIASELEGTEWRPFHLRGIPPHGPDAAGSVLEVDGENPRIQVRSDYQVISYQGLVDARTGLAAVGPWGVDVLLSSPDERYRRLAEGAFLAPDREHLGLVLRGALSAEIAIVDISSSRPRVLRVVLGPEVRDVEPRSLTLTRTSVFFGAQLASKKWSLYRAPLSPAGSSEFLAAEPISEPVDHSGKYMAFSREFVAFLGGASKDSLDVFVAGAAGPAVNVTRDPGPILEHSPADGRLAVSDDGSRLAYNRRVGSEPETYWHDVASPGPGGERHITADEEFNPYIDQESLIFFNASGQLLFAAGHDPVTTDLYRVDPAIQDGVINLTRTGSGLLPPFLTKGTLTIQDVISASSDVVLVAATGFPGATPDGIVGISSETGATLFEMPGLTGASGFFSVGVDLYFTATRPDGSIGLYRVSGQVIAEAGSAPAASQPRLLLQSTERAIFLLPGTGLLELTAGASPRVLVPAADLAPSVAMDPVKGVLIFGRIVPGGYEYVRLDIATGAETPLSGAPLSGQILAVANALQVFVRGDANADGGMDIADAISVLILLFVGPIPIRCEDAGDANDDGKLNISDPIHVLRCLFQGGPQPPAPFPSPGFDLTPDALGCGAG